MARNCAGWCSCLKSRLRPTIQQQNTHEPASAGKGVAAVPERG